MADIFDNANTNVTVRSYGSTYGKKITDKNLIPVKNRKKAEVVNESAKFNEMNKSLESKKLEAYRNERTREVAIAESYDKLRDDLMFSIFEEICIESMLIDSDVAYANANNITSIVKEHLDNLGGYKGIKEIAKNTENPLLESFVSIVESTAKGVGDRAITVADQQEMLNQFKMNADEVKDFDYSKKAVGVQTIASAVKNKVFNVVKKEQESQQAQSEIMDEVKDRLSDLQAPVQEAMEFIFDKKGVEECSLFSSLMRKSYKGLLESNSSTIFESVLLESDDSDEDDDEYDLNEIELDDDEFIEDVDDCDDDELTELMLGESAVFEAYEFGDAELLEERLSKLINSIKALTEGCRTKKASKKAKKTIREVQKNCEMIDEACKKRKLKEENSDKEVASNAKADSGMDTNSDLTEEVDDKTLVVTAKNAKATAEEVDAKTLVVTAKNAKATAEEVNEKDLVTTAKCSKVAEEVDDKTLVVTAKNSKAVAEEVSDKDLVVTAKTSDKTDKDDEPEAVLSEMKVVDSDDKEKAECEDPECEMPEGDNDNPLIDEEPDTDGEAKGDDDTEDAVVLLGESIGIENFEGTTQSLLALINKASSKEEFEAIAKDANLANTKLNEIKKARPESAEKVDAFVSWLKQFYVPAIKLRIKDLEANKAEIKNCEKMMEGMDPKSLITISKNINNRPITTGNFEGIRPALMSLACQACQADIDELRKDQLAVVSKLNQVKKEQPLLGEKIDAHISWLGGEYEKAVSGRQLQIQKKNLLESFSNDVDEICDRLTAVIDKHEDALYEAINSMQVSYGDQLMNIPLIEANILDKNNINFAYKVKAVCEGLKSQLYNVKTEVDSVELEAMTNHNLEVIASLQECAAAKGLLYKENILESAKRYLGKVKEKTNVLCESNHIENNEQALKEAVQNVADICKFMNRDLLLESTQDSTMELVMAEAIVNYTVLEMFNTLKLAHYDKDSVRKMSRANIQ